MEMYNPEQARSFLSELGGRGPFVFQTFTDNKENKSALKRHPVSGKPMDPLAKVMVGSFKEHADTLKKLSEKGAGVFVQINEGTRRSKDHITKIRALFIDADEPDTATETMASLMKYMPRPTMIVQSSKGKFHVYWKVSDCPVESFKAMQQQLAIQFGTDPSVKNLDRVLRLPGFPHQKGEPTPVIAKITGLQRAYATQRIYDHAAKAPRLQRIIDEQHTGPDKPKKVKVHDAFGLNYSEEYVEPTVLAPGGRTTKLVAHIGKMVATGYSAEAVRKEIIRMNVELCPEGSEPIEAGILEYEVLGAIDKFVDQRTEDTANYSEPDIIPPPPNTDAAIEQATSKAPSVQATYAMLLEDSNSLDAWVERFRYVEQNSRIIDTTLKGDYSTYTLQDFKNLTQNIKVGGKAFLSKKWLECPERKTVRDTIYIPKNEAIVRENNSDFWNLYAPANIVPVPELDPEAMKPFYAHMEFMFPETQDRELFMNWFACTVTKPELRIPWVPLIVTEPGAGKGLIYELLASLVGRHNSIMILPERLASPFNSFLQNKTLVCIDEMHKNIKGGVVEKLNHIISESQIEINTKGVREKPEKVYCNLLMFSNNIDATLVNKGDRRFWVQQVDGVQSPLYYNNLWDWLRNKENLSNMMAWCQQRDLSTFAYNSPPPNTFAKQDMILHSRSHLETLLVDAITNREGPFGADVTSYTMVENFLSSKLNVPINNDMSDRIRSEWAKASRSLGTGQIRTNDIQSTERHRPRCIRNYRHWKQADTVDLKYELTRAHSMLLKRPALPPRLEEVTK